MRHILFRKNHRPASNKYHQYQQLQSTTGP